MSNIESLGIFNKTVSRRTFVKWLPLAGTILAGCSSPKSRDALPPQVDKTQQLAALRKDYLAADIVLTERLKSLDTSMRNLHDLVQDDLLLLPESERDQMELPFSLYEANQSNQDRSLFAFFLNDFSSRGTQALESVPKFTISDPRYFRIGFFTSPNNAAEYTYAIQALNINPNMSINSLLGAVIIYHEMVHKNQDMKDRSKYSSSEQIQKYEDFYTSKGNEKPRLIPASEHQAYAQEILLVNLLSKGQLKEGVMNNTIKLEDYQRLLGASNPLEAGTVKLIIELATIYFISGSSLSTISPEFAQYINTNLLRGIEFYTIDKSGTIKKGL